MAICAAKRVVREDLGLIRRMKTKVTMMDSGIEQRKFKALGIHLFKNEATERMITMDDALLPLGYRKTKPNTFTRQPALREFLKKNRL